MLFEAHVTVDSNDIEAWQECCREVLIKPLLIRLSHGAHPNQLMCAALFSADIELAARQVEVLENRIKEAGFKILRTKLECQLAHSACVQKPSYFECHMKLTLDEAGASKLLSVAQELGIAASTNLLAVNGKWERWYLTSRDYMKDMGIAIDEFQRLRRQVEQYLPVEEMDMECVIFDTNPGLDRGWVDIPA